MQGYLHSPPISPFKGYSNEDWAAYVDTHQNIGGFLFILSGEAISWTNKKQLTISLSTTKVEYRALANGARKRTHIKQLLTDLFLPTSISINHSNPLVYSTISSASYLSALDVHLCCDNVSALKLAKHPVFHAHLKHIELHHHYVQGRVLEE